MANESTSLLEAMFIHGLDLRKRRVFLHAPMDTDEESSSNAVEKAVKALLYLDSTKREFPIELWLNTPGGSLPEMFGLYDVIQTLESEVHTVGFGEVCSAGCLILVGGTKRYCTPNCIFMSHQGDFDLEGDLSTLTQRAAFYNKENLKWASLMAKHTKHTKKWWADLHKTEIRELYLDAKGMLRHGIVDEVWE